MEMKALGVVSAFLLCFFSRSDGLACQSTNQELVFVVGTVSGPSAWPPLIDFTNKVIDGFVNVSQSGTRISFVRYIGRRPLIVFHLDLYNDKNSVMKAVEAIEYSAEKATEAGDLASAIDLVRTEAFYPATSRPSARKTAILVVDKLPPPTDSSRLRRSVAEAEVSGIELIAVGIGIENIDLLHRLGRREHNGTRSHRTTYVVDRSQLGNIVTTTTIMACYEGLPLSATNQKETDKQNDYDTYLDMGVYPDASVDDQHVVAEEKRSHTGVTAVIVVLGALVLLMLSFAAIVYCRRKVREQTEMKVALALKQSEIAGGLRRPSLIKSNHLDTTTRETMTYQSSLLASAKFKPGPNAHQSLGTRPWVVADVSRT